MDVPGGQVEPLCRSIDEANKCPAGSGSRDAKEQGGEGRGEEVKRLFGVVIFKRYVFCIM